MTRVPENGESFNNNFLVKVKNILHKLEHYMSILKLFNKKYYSTSRRYRFDVQI